MDVTKRTKQGNGNQSTRWQPANFNLFLIYRTHKSNQMTEFWNGEIPNFGVSACNLCESFQYFCRGNLPKSNVYPNQKVNVFQTDSLKAFTLQNDFSELRLTISSRNWKELLPVSAWASICLSVYLLQICCIFSEYLFLRTPLDSCFCCIDNCCFIGSE